MKNPIPSNSFFSSPKSADELFKYIDRMTGSEKALAYTIAMMTLNLSYNLVEKELKETA